MDIARIREVVHEVVLEVVRERSPEHGVVADANRLAQDLGLKSLDLARILALLEVRLEGDPFAELVPVTSVRTVGDICNAYNRLFAGEKPSDAGWETGTSRAEKRRSARGRE